MKVMIIRPPYVDYAGTEPPRIGIPLGALSIASSIEGRGHEVKVFDSLVYMDKNEDKSHFGASWERIKKEFVSFGPDVVGIVNLFSSQLENAFRLPAMLKEIKPSVKIIVGGPHATVKPEDFLASGVFDFAIMGEGEVTGADIVDYYAGKKGLEEINGVAYMTEGGMKIHPLEYIPDLNVLPFPAYHLVDMENYFYLVRGGFGSRPQDPFQKPKREITMITSRGCPYTCTFCSIHPTMGYKYRTQSAEYVVSHIELLVKKYGVELIHFEDDNLTLDVKRFHSIMDMVLERNIVFGWDTPNGVRADTLKKDLLEKMAKTGVSELRIAVESADQEILDKVVKKALDLNCIEQVAANCKKLGIRLAAFFVIGMPGETKGHIKKTLDFAYYLMKKYNVTPHVNIANPLVGTELYNTAKERGYIVDEDYTHGYIFGSGRIRTEEFSPEDLQAFTKEFYKKVRKLYVYKMVKDPKKMLRNVGNFVYYPRSTIRLMRIASRYTG